MMYCEFSYFLSSKNVCSLSSAYCFHPIQYFMNAHTFQFLLVNDLIEVQYTPIEFLSEKEQR